MDEATVGRGLGCNGAAFADVKIGDFLTQSGSEVGHSDILDNSICCVGQKRIVDVGEDESADAEVDKVEAAERRSI